MKISKSLANLTHLNKLPQENPEQLILLGQLSAKDLPVCLV